MYKTRNLTKSCLNTALASALALLTSHVFSIEAPLDGVDSDRIDWGVMMDLSGPTSASQGIWVNGFQDHMRKVNETGGVYGRKINVLTEDSRYNAATDKVNFEKLLTQTPVLGISGLGTSGAQVALAPAIKSGKVPIVATYTTTKALSEPVSPMVYGGFCGYKQMAKTGIGYFADKLKLKAPKVMTVHIESAGGVEYAEMVNETVTKLGGTARSVSMKVTAADVTPQVLEILAFKPDFVTVYGVSNTSILTAKGMHQYGLKTPIFGISYLGAPQIFTALGPDAGANYFFVSCFTPGGSDASPGNKTLVEFADKYNHSAIKEDINYVAGWVAAQIVTEALLKTGKEPTRAKLVEAMNKGFSVDTKGLSAPIVFTKDDHTGPSILKTFNYDYASKKFKPFGDYADYMKYLR